MASNLATPQSPTALPAVASRRAGAHPIGAVVIGGDYQGLGIARSLGRRNVPVCIIDDERSIGRFSRYATHWVPVPSLRGDEETVEALLNAGRRLGLHGWVLFPTRDETVAAISQHRSVLSEVFRVPTPEWQAIKWAWDKRNTYQLAERLGIPAPQTWYPRSLEDLERIPARPTYALKPAIKEHFIYATKAKAWRADSRDELRERFLAAQAQLADGEIMIQDMIPGSGAQQFAFCAFFKEGRAIGSMTARRTRQHPPDFGRASTYVETVTVPEIEEFSLRFLREIGYYGLVELEYKRDPRDQQYRLLDVNARTWGYHTLGQAAGVDFPSMLYSDQIGEAVVPGRARSGVSWVRLLTDVPTGAVEIWRKRQKPLGYLRSVAAADTEAVFSWSDPAPGLAEVALLPYLTLKRGF